MKNKKILLSAALFLCATFSVLAQEGFGTNLPAPSAVVDMVASDKGVLLPRVALEGLTDVTTIENPADALTVFNTATVGTAPNNLTPGYYYWSAARYRWVRLIDIEADVRAVNLRSHITKDAGLNGSEGISAGGNNNILLGEGAGNTGNSNIALGSAALTNVTQSYNIGIGNNTLQQITGSNSNIAIGYLTATNLISGNGNIFIGAGTQPNVSTTSSNQLNIGNWIYGNAGLIGLGTDAANPGQRLDVANGNLRVRDIILPANAGGATDKVVVADGTGIFKSVDRATLANNLYTTNGTLAANRTVNMNEKSLVFTSAERDIFFDNAGRIGNIAKGTNDADIFLSSGTGSTYNRFDIQSFPGGEINLTATGQGNVELFIGTHSTQNAAPVIFSTSSGSGALGTEKMRITGTGNVGLAIVNPTEKLDVNGVTRVRNLPLNGTANSISTTPAGGLSSSQNQTFTGSRTIVADSNGVLGAVNGLPVITEVDGVIGNEVTNATTNGGLTRTGAGTNASPYTLGLPATATTGQTMTYNGTAWVPAHLTTVLAGADGLDATPTNYTLSSINNNAGFQQLTTKSFTLTQKTLVTFSYRVGISNVVRSNGAELNDGLSKLFGAYITWDALPAGSPFTVGDSFSMTVVPFTNGGAGYTTGFFYLNGQRSIVLNPGTYSVGLYGYVRANDNVQGVRATFNQSDQFDIIGTPVQ